MLQFAQAHVVWIEEQWSSIHFSDESKFNVIDSDGKTYIRRKTGARLRVNCVKKTVKHGGGSVMVWECALLKDLVHWFVYMEE